MARVSTNLLDAAPAISGKDLRTIVPFSLGSTVDAASAAITVTSSDAAQVVIANDPSEPGQSSIKLSPAQQGTATRYFYADCLVDKGGSDLTLSAPGYPNRVAHVSCFPASAFIVFRSAFGLTGHTNLWARPVEVDFYLGAVNPNDSSQANFNLAIRPGAPPIALQIGNSDAQVGTLSSSTMTVSGATNFQSSVMFTPLMTGTTILSVTSPSLTPTASSQLTVTVDPPIAVSQTVAVPYGFQTFVNLSVATPPNPNFSLTVTSQDPSRILISIDPSEPGSSSLSLPYTLAGGRGFYVQALSASGDVPVTIAIPELDAISTTIHLSSPTLSLASSAILIDSLSLAVGQSTTVSAAINVADGRRSPFGHLPNPGTDPVRVVLNTSNAATVAVSPAVGELSTSGSVFGPVVNFQIQALTEGAAVLTLQSLNAIPVAASPVNVVIKNKPLGP